MPGLNNSSEISIDQNLSQHIDTVRSIALLIEQVRGFTPGSLTCFAQLVQEGDLTYAEVIRVFAQHFERIADTTDLEGLTP